MECQYPTAGLASSEKHEALPGARWRNEVGTRRASGPSRRCGQLLSSAWPADSQRPKSEAGDIIEVNDAQAQHRHHGGRPAGQCRLPRPKSPPEQRSLNRSPPSLFGSPLGEDIRITSWA